jgi:crotonobetainyl-CoA:carnitine CoA-transferase CaiB-like acyl-CoA transferase
MGPLRGIRVLEVAGQGPGTMERLGLGPQDCMAANPALSRGRRHHMNADLDRGGCHE